MSTASSMPTETDLGMIKRNKLHKTKFYEAILDMQLEQQLTQHEETTQQNSRLLSNVEYQQLIQDMEQARSVKG